MLTLQPDVIDLTVEEEEDGGVSRKLYSYELQDRVESPAANKVIDLTRPAEEQDIRSAYLAVNFAQLQQAILPVIATSQQHYVALCDGVVTRGNDVFAGYLVAVGKCLVNSGLAMINRGNELLRLADEKKRSLRPESTANTSQSKNWKLWRGEWRVVLQTSI